MSHAVSVPHSAPSMQVPSRNSSSRKGGRVVHFTPRPHRFFSENDLIDHYGPELGLEGVGLYCALQRYANRQTGECWPSVPMLAKQFRTSASTIRRHFRKLEACGLIAREPRYARGKGQTSNLYTVHHATNPPQVLERNALSNLTGGVDT